MSYENNLNTINNSYQTDGTIHFSKLRKIRKKENKEINSFAKNLVSYLNKNKIQCNMLLGGFRSEYDNYPVIERITNEKREKIPYYCGEGNWCEYAILKEINDEIHLYDYYGPAGKSWSGENLIILEKAFDTL